MSKALAVPLFHNFLGNWENNAAVFHIHLQYFLHAMNLKFYFTLFC